MHKTFWTQENIKIIKYEVSSYFNIKVKDFNRKEFKHILLN